MNIINHQEAYLSMIKHFVLLVMLAVSLAGCDTVGYYGQGIQGQYSVWKVRVPLAKALDNPGLTDLQRRHLQQVARIRAFASEQLHLPIKHEYDTYADVGRRYVAWIVMAAPAYALEPRTWCYPLVGCLDYHGFFSQNKATRYALALKRQGMDVYVAPVQAYSTLGWFRDPVLNGFLNLDEPEMAELIFHELAHQKLFFKGDTAFNESFANAVAEEGLRRYAEAYHLDLTAWQEHQNAQHQVMQLLMQTRQSLAAIYRRAESIDQMQLEKHKALQLLQSRFLEQARQQPSLQQFATFVAHANNASLASAADYHDLVPLFQAMLQHDGGDLQKFFSDCAELKHIHPAARRAALTQWVKEYSHD